MRPDRKRRLPLLIGAGLALITLAVYGGLLRCDFVNFDDNGYVTENPHVQGGLTFEGLRWAFNIGYNSNWHPLTWLSHMADCQLFGLDPWGHHLTNLLLHLANTLLLFGLLKRATGALWPSATVAALFAWHPAHVESVAWVSERKDVLSTSFFLLTLWAYVRYAQSRSARSAVRGPEAGSRVEGRGSKAAPSLAPRPSPLVPRPSPPARSTLHAPRWYLLALVCFALGLMSKAMLVTLPFVLLLLDYWPLGRFELKTKNLKLQTLFLLFGEKLPFFLLAAAASAITVVAQGRGGAVVGTALIPFSARCGNALMSYLRYAGELLWPRRLAVFYPYPGPWPPWLIGCAALLLLAVCGLALGLRRRAPWLCVGWFWFLGTLVPVIGLVQVGEQAMADRYTYIPSIGFFIVICWAARQLLRQPALSLAGAGALCLCALLARAQAACWRNSLSLFEHAVAVTGDNATAQTALGAALAATNRFEEAIGHYQLALQLKPGHTLARENLGGALARLGRWDEALAQYQLVLALNPDDVLAHYNLANLLNPDFVEAVAPGVNGTGRRTDSQQARQHYLRALALDPGYLNARINLGNLEASEGNAAAAIDCYEAALRTDPHSALAHFSLASLLAVAPQLERHLQAVEHFRQALRLKPDWVEALNNLAWMLATDQNPQVRNGAEAVKLATRAGELTGFKEAHVLSTLDAAWAEAGRFAEAIDAAQKTCQQALAGGDQEWAAAARARLLLYQAGRPYHQGEDRSGR